MVATLRLSGMTTTVRAIHAMVDEVLKPLSRRMPSFGIVKDGNREKTCCR
jgi:hypothetical protein